MLNPCIYDLLLIIMLVLFVLFQILKMRLIALRLHHHRCKKNLVIVLRDSDIEW